MRADEPGATEADVAFGPLGWQRLARVLGLLEHRFARAGAGGGGGTPKAPDGNAQKAAAPASARVIRQVGRDEP